MRKTEDIYQCAINLGWELQAKAKQKSGAPLWRKKSFGPIFYLSLCLLLSGTAQASSIPGLTVHDSLPAGLLIPPKRYVASKINRALHIDGKLNESAWQEAPWSDLFEDIAGVSVTGVMRKDAASGILPTQVKMCWDSQYLYIGARLKDPNLQASLRTRDTIIYHNNDFEVFFTTGPAVNTYYELEVNQQGTLLDLLMPKAYRSGGNALIHWDLKGLKMAVDLQGTLNNAMDRDSGWTVEMAIPYTGVLPFGARRPEAGDYWRINFSRVQWDGHTSSEGWRRNRSKDGRLAREHNWVWSPQGMVDMHAPDRWGYLFFEADSSAKVVLPLIEIQKMALWKIYYQQQWYRRLHGNFALTLGELKANPKVILKDPVTGKVQTYSLQLTAGGDWFRLSLTGPGSSGSRILSLDQNGLMENIIQDK